MYSSQEIQLIQKTIAGIRGLSKEDFVTIKNNGQDKEIPGFLSPFIGLIAINPDLYRKIAEDERAKKYSLYGFFPETIDLVYGSETSPELSVGMGQRGLIGLISHPRKKIIIKPVQNSRERETASVADELGVGPKQYKTLGNFLTEQFIEGDLFPNINGHKKSPENIYIVGRRVGEILSKLHSRDIYYNDTILTDDFGRSHVIVQENPNHTVLFDYGVSIRLNNHPNLSDEEVYNFVRTLPIINMFIQTPFGQQPSKEELDSVVREFRPKLQLYTKEQIMSRDMKFIKEGLTYAQYRIGNIAGPFTKGFNETYL